ncbi:hypothetical protein [Psychroserpens sp. SPM9]|uniref:hypothetical protein n=1 Tax=Psychroserpens sp. SPM9 TaxID=2975598 RepID=UPI0021A54F05|nr:hypothetical protein [Psychroserpens sp. SPM9]MDG5492953.1 hypothetical protein [Psychroserpens sp. SPM9]
MKKNFKLVLLSFGMIALLFSSCTNDEPVVQEQNIDESTSITTSLSQLRLQFNSEGNVIPDENPTGNIVFDFCFDFVYPLNLSYNNGTTVTVNGLDDLIEVMINSNDDLYVNGIAFPFDVETYDADSGAIVVETISNEDAFIDLLESCDFETAEPCECFEDYNPVCVEVEAPNGDIFLVSYPNACYAACDGFTPNNFAEDCENDYNYPGGNDCFEFNFPLSIITDNGDTIEVNSQQELDTALYNSYYFDFVYSFDVTLSDGTLLTIGHEEGFIELLETCSNENGCPCPADVNPVCVEVESPNGNTEIITFLNACEAECEGYTEADFVDCENNTNCDCSDEVNPVCVEVESPNGNTEIITFLNACEAECEGYTEADFVDCENTNPDCTPNSILPILLECPWSVDDTFYYNFSSNGEVTITGEGLSSNGTWHVTMGNEGYPIVVINDVNGNLIDEWSFVDCNLINSLLVISSENPSSNIALSCD